MPIIILGAPGNPESGAQVAAEIRFSPGPVAPNPIIGRPPATHSAGGTCAGRGWATVGIARPILGPASPVVGARPASLRHCGPGIWGRTIGTGRRSRGSRPTAPVVGRARAVRPVSTGLRTPIVGRARAVRPVTTGLGTPIGGASIGRLSAGRPRLPRSGSGRARFPHERTSLRPDGPICDGTITGGTITGGTITDGTITDGTSGAGAPVPLPFTSTVPTAGPVPLTPPALEGSSGSARRGATAAGFRFGSRPLSARAVSVGSLPRSTPCLPELGSIRAFAALPRPVALALRASGRWPPTLSRRSPIHRGLTSRPISPTVGPRSTIIPRAIRTLTDPVRPHKWRSVTPWRRTTTSGPTSRGRRSLGLVADPFAVDPAVTGAIIDTLPGRAHRAGGPRLSTRGRTPDSILVRGVRHFCSARRWLCCFFFPPVCPLPQPPPTRSASGAAIAAPAIGAPAGQEPVWPTRTCASVGLAGSRHFVRGPTPQRRHHTSRGRHGRQFRCW